jgi:hypothetical protein
VHDLWAKPTAPCAVCSSVDSGDGMTDDYGVYEHSRAEGHNAVIHHADFSFSNDGAGLRGDDEFCHLRCLRYSPNLTMMGRDRVVVLQAIAPRTYGHSFTVRRWSRRKSFETHEDPRCRTNGPYRTTLVSNSSVLNERQYAGTGRARAPNRAASRSHVASSKPIGSVVQRTRRPTHATVSDRWRNRYERTSGRAQHISRPYDSRVLDVFAVECCACRTFLPV